ncbi:hypothetical protein WJ69_34155 [Burkholderia ubonensis]|nr:hypothetical protein WJ69_34155 [Burkholderia ubonensis]
MTELNEAGKFFLRKLSKISGDASEIKNTVIKDTVEWLFKSVVGTVASELSRVSDNFGHVDGESTNKQWSQLASMLGICRTARDLALSECGTKWMENTERDGYLDLPIWLRELRDKIDGKRSASPAKSDVSSSTEKNEAATNEQLSDTELDIVAKAIHAGTSHRINFFEKTVYISTLALISALTNGDSKTALAEANKIISATNDFRQFHADLTLDAYVPQVDGYDDDVVSTSRHMLEMAKEDIGRVIRLAKDFYDFAQSAREKDGIWNRWTMPGGAIRMQVAKAVLNALVLRSEGLSYGGGADNELMDLANNSAAGRAIDYDKIESARNACLAGHAWTKQFMVDFHDYKEAIIDSIPNKNKSKFPLKKEFDAIECKIKEASVERVSLLARLDDAMSAS